MNRGVYPLNPATEVGQFRLRSGDVNSLPLDPVEIGYQSYTLWSDDEISAFLTQGNGSIPRAIGWAYLALASQATLTGASIRDYDLAIDDRNRGKDLSAIAQFWFDLANDEDAGSDEAFLIVPTGRRHPHWNHAELAGHWHGVW